MKRNEITAILIIVLVFSAAASLGAVSVTLADVVTYDGSAIALDAAVRIDDCPPDVADRILAETIGAAPGKLHIIPKRIVREIVSQWADGPIVITGSRIIAIPSSYGENEKRFLAGLLSFIDATEGARETRIEIIPEVPTGGLFRTNAKASDARDISPLFRIVSKRTKAGFFEGETTIGYDSASNDASGAIRLTIHSFVPVLRTRSALARGELFSTNGFEAVEVPVSALESEPFADDLKLSNYSAKYAIPARAIVYTRLVEKSYDVKSNDAVRLVIHKGNIWLTMPGRARDSGTRGETVRVKPTESDRSFTGTITGTREVTVDLATN
jgi:flagella basal body P-ring formation protein FlgA